ncbi:MAG: DUF2330 domain-containing protein [Myxococcales bacterium]|nr:DUF2330 domain-containing protein [Myxococcales bacterium]
MTLPRLLLTVAAAALLLAENQASACGCFAPPDPTRPIVQAGERIVFAVSGTEITAHIQIQYAGSAEEFGWLLPLPSLPTLELGVDELFAKLIEKTQPQFQLRQVFPNNCFNNNQGGFGSGAAYDLGRAPSDLGMAGSGGPPSPLVVQDTIGPYDYAVLKADSKKDMLDWLAKNHYFVPAGTTDAVDPYIHPGAFFLALKLRSGQSSGSIQPVVVRYASDLPMIPLVLTSVAAQENMGIQVWVLGPARAIPRNYYHTVLNDAAIDWLSPTATYKDLITRAVADAPGRHSFVTEFAGSASVMRNVLNSPGRFGDRVALRTLTDASLYLRFLRNNGFLPSSTLVAILQKHLPMPAALAAQGISPGTFYWNFDIFKNQQPDLFPNGAPRFDPILLTADLEARVIKPTLAAGKLFDPLPYLTQLYTTLSPLDMTKDPAFSFNPSLPDVSNVRKATLTWRCHPDHSGYAPEALNTDGGFAWYYRAGSNPNDLPKLPASLRTEVLRESGPPEVVTDNRAQIEAALGMTSESGCRVATGFDPARAITLLALLLGLCVLGRLAARPSRARS